MLKVWSCRQLPGFDGHWNAAPSCRADGQRVQRARNASPAALQITNWPSEIRIRRAADLPRSRTTKCLCRRNPLPVAQAGSTWKNGVVCDRSVRPRCRACGRTRPTPRVRDNAQEGRGSSKITPKLPNWPLALLPTGNPDSIRILRILCFLRQVEPRRPSQGPVSDPGTYSRIPRGRLRRSMQAGCLKYARVREAGTGTRFVCSQADRSTSDGRNALKTGPLARARVLYRRFVNPRWFGA